MTSPVVDAGDGLALTIPRLLRRQAAVRPDATFVVCDADRIGYGAASERSAELARGLLAAGVTKGSRVALLYPNSIEFVVAWLAVNRIGAVAVPLSTFSTGPELIGMLRGADVEVLLGTAGYRGHDYTSRVPFPGDRTVPVLRRVLLGDEVGALVRSGNSIDPAVLVAAEEQVDPSDPMVIVHTSGSTSAPKGVVHLHGPLIRHMDNLNELRRYSPDEILFAASPWFWIGGFAYALLGTLIAGARLVCSGAAAAAAVLDVIEAERPTMVNGFAQAVAHLPQDPSFAQRDLSSIRRGNLWPLLPDDVRPDDPGLRHTMLGMTETGSVCLLAPGGDDEVPLAEHQRGSFGVPAPGFETKVVDLDTGEICETGQVGELWLRGPFLMDGYDGRERSETFDPDGWFNTGDLLHVDDDGLHYFHGRSGQMIKTSGANVSPVEVEAAIGEVAGMRAHVVGLDSDERGQVVAAALVSAEPVDTDQLGVALREHLSAYKVPRRWIVLTEDEVPVMSSGKLDLRALKERFDG